ncbi:hydrogenase expression/formation protein HypE [Sulfuriferula nivalis]|uniref:Hydrogenase expression/formation protein HypE n=1 Tax=Sulfuriferula nivalis TaxID=2675298 RepID=A0A809RQQ2_9PROT|nr:hydrogenase expression/formation protein HypE [Sulfuriferula nivalis]BBP01171.1 hydrogenase expression/formation protein HypE [Sulfuriferula nivalis]
MTDAYITLAHGNGGRYMRELIERVFARHLGNPLLDVNVDAARLPWDAGELMFTTDGFTVQPLEFPGGDIGSLAVHGTVNDLAVSGATPRYLSLNAFIEEGLPLAQLDRIIASLARAAKAAGVVVVAGDTKVVRRGEGGGLYLATAGIGVRTPGVTLGMQTIQAGDVILVSGPVGDHGIAVMLAREQFGLKGELASDSACVLPLTQALLGLPGLRFMRDPTRGGLATVACEISHATGLQVNLQQSAIPVRDPVSAVCEMLGYDPYYLACEGRVVAVVAESDAAVALDAWRKLPDGKDAAQIGYLQPGRVEVVLHTPLGGTRILDELEDDPLPRIC